jgi:hypothetical protein
MLPKQVLVVFHCESVLTTTGHHISLHQLFQVNWKLLLLMMLLLLLMMMMMALRYLALQHHSV